MKDGINKKETLCPGLHRETLSEKGNEGRKERGREGDREKKRIKENQKKRRRKRRKQSNSQFEKKTWLLVDLHLFIYTLIPGFSDFIY